MTSLPSLIERTFGASLIQRVPRDHEQSDQDFRRRRIVTALFLVLGAALLGVSLSVPPGAGAFYPLTLAVATVWAVGGVLSGPLHLGYIQRGDSLRRPVLAALGVGLVAAGIFVAGALVVREIGPLRDYVDSILAHARRGSLSLITLVTVVNGIAEEVFFRGGLFAAIGRRYPIIISTAIYAAATLATGNPMLVFAAVTLGVVLALQRRASGGILAPAITHVTWSMIMLFVLPLLFAARP